MRVMLLLLETNIAQEGTDINENCANLEPCHTRLYFTLLLEQNPTADTPKIFSFLKTQ